MKTLAIILSFAAAIAACTTGPDYWGPFWGDYCTPKRDPDVLYLCDHWNASATEESFGYCDDEDACRPFCDENDTCPKGGVPKFEPQWGLCYCEPG